MSDGTRREFLLYSSAGTAKPQRSPAAWIGTGVILAATGGVAALLFKFFIVHPAYTPLPNGHYGEMYGPVSYFRIPIYIVCGLIFVAGLASVAIGASRGNARRGDH